MRVFAYRDASCTEPCSTTVVGEEQPGGLVIVRASSTRPALSQESQATTRPRAGSRQPSIPPTNGTHAVPPAKKYKAGVDPPSLLDRKGKKREVLANNRTEHDVDEDVRMMQSETDSLRRRSRAAQSSAGLNPDFSFPAPSTNGRTNGRATTKPATSRGRAATRELSQVLPDDDTPRIERNKLLRGDPGNSRRQSSLTRGKRVSSTYVSTGVISMHSFVSPTTVSYLLTLFSPATYISRRFNFL